MQTLTEIAAAIARHVSKDGFQATPIERVTLVRSSTVTMPTPNVYRPQLCLVAQGRKEVTLGDRVFRYTPGCYGVVTYDLPAIGHVVEATPDKPYLCLYLDFDPVMLGDLAMRVPPPPRAPSPPIGKTVTDAGAGLLDAALRLLRLLDDPAAVPVLGPLAEQEILYRLLAGPDGARMRHITSGQGPVAQIGRAIAWIGKNFRERFSIERLATEVGMSPSSLHEHFRAVTAMTPLQFQKQLRLQDARSLMLVQNIDVTTAAFRVGYESPSQFSREYRRHFGDSPARDIARLRASPSLAVVA
ncbi:AraC family transcriptional regulator [Rhizobium leguminosarum]|uniref:AraC family transcriptional regulator n=1 Tax=Rhizobium leguminosarum TaxID=384 RepID=UPI001C93D21A|nr:AraC family transcriptional regulator [Rhizobium leguminosarum]MBY5546421.1 AraC family transcriptional regulator [Rhizobium leguminosarum]MBY5587328.1 AraC family transcriptional regulator [Rhizobium leguminosarum]MBY5661365.1 AraC family transcriptional regulator [Rhizobium leguminosarum]MBY5674179.1 AraC family transcriptional regulator [Rhizobium leguminosarum]MBY5810937.1 AraC family transcriptional regulator [Rhizobium leguminosarum]